jgi:glycosyltransferase involved in cell wall biosynthesis
VREMYVNGAFLGQQLSGQQRYATEVMAHLVDRQGMRVLRPPRAFTTRPVLAHAWAHGALPALSAGGTLLSLTARSPVAARRHVVVVHDLFVLRHPEWFSKGYSRTHAPVLAAQLRTAAGLVAVSPAIAAQVRELLPHKPMIVGPNAPSESFRSPARAEMPAAVRELTEDPAVEGFLFAVGSRDPRKNFGRLTAAYASLPDALRTAYPLVIAGGESSIYADHAVARADHVLHIGHMKDPALAALYAEARAVIVPSLDEGFGLPVVEAMARGARLALSDIPTFTWLAGDSARYFSPHSVPEMAQVIRGVIEDPPPAGPPEAVYSRFSWARTSDAIVDFADALA